MAYVYDAGGGGRKKEEEERQRSLNHFKLERDEQIMNRNDPGGGVYVKPTQPETSEEQQSYQYTGGQNEKPAEPVYSEEPEPVQEAEAQKPPEPVYTEQPETLAEATENVETEAKPQKEETTQPIVYAGATVTTPKTGAENTKADLTDEEQDDAWYAENGLSWAAPRNNAADQSEPKQQKGGNMTMPNNYRPTESNSGSLYEQNTVQPTAAAGTLPGMGRPQGNRRMNVIDLSQVPNDPQYQQRLQLYRSQGYSDASAASAAAGDVINADAQREANAIAARRRADQAAADNLANTAAVNRIAAQRRADQAAADNLANQNYVNALGAAQRAGYEYNPPTNGYVPTNLLRSEDFDRTSEYNPEQTFYQSSGQNREVGIREDGTIYDRPITAQKANKSDIVTPDRSDLEFGRGDEISEAYQRAIEALNRQGIYGEEAEKQAQGLVKETESVKNWFNPEIERYYGSANPETTPGVNAAQNPSNRNRGQMETTPTAETQAPTTPARTPSTGETVAAVMQEHPEFTVDQAVEYIQNGGKTESGLSYNPEQTSLEQQLPGIMESGKSGPTVYDTSQIKGLSTASGEVRAPGATTPTDSDKIPKGSLRLTPSYNQGGEVVKAPYKAGGYTEEELIAMGNNAYGKQYGSNVYEGYYKAPDGNYYPVDQEKAEYYKANGSYKGWEEGMRKYYQTFGTFYGYKPNWQQTGRSYGGGGRSYSYRGYSRSSGGGGGSYGSGSPANNGLYWNPNSSWSI